MLWSNVPPGSSWGCGWAAEQVYSWPAEDNEPSVVPCSGGLLYPGETSPNIPETQTQEPRVLGIDFTQRRMDYRQNNDVIK